MGGYRLLHHLADDAFQRAGGVGADHRRRVRCRGAAQAALLGEQVGHAAAADVGAVRQGGKGAQQVFELGVVVRPRVLPQHLDGAGLKAGDLLAQLQIQAVQVQTGKGRDLIRPAAQRGQFQRQRAQPLDKAAGDRRDRLFRAHRAGEQQPHPAGKTGLLDGSQQFGAPLFRDSLKVLEVDRVAVGVQGRVIVVEQKIP